MARIARVVAVGMPHHITQRGNRRQETFFCEEDFKLYRELMARWCSCCIMAIWAYCLMPNHVHLIAVPRNEKALSRAIGEAHRRYTSHINFRENWRGHLWQGRFASYVMDEDYLLKAVRYVELNPVKAGLSDTPWDYRWSSARAHLEGNDDVLVRVQPMLRVVDDWREYLALNIDEEEAALMRRHERTGRPLGSHEFIKRLEKKTHRILLPKKRGPKGPRKNN